MKIYNVTGTAWDGDTSSHAEPFSINVCAANKRDAYHYAAEGMASRGWASAIPLAAEDLGGYSVREPWTPGQTVLISA